MKNENKTIELLTESLVRQDRLVDRMDTTNEKLDQTVNRLDQTVAGLNKLESRTEKIEDQLIKLNLQTIENSRGIFKLVEKIDQIADLHNRITKLEKTVFK